MTQINVYRFGFSHDYHSLNGLGDIWSSVATGSGAAASIVASGAATSTLISAGVALETVPIVGQILGTVAIVAGFIAAAHAKAKAIKNNIADVETQQKELRLQSVELDKNISSIVDQKNSIYQQLQSIGLNGFGDWLKKTFTPAKYYGEIQSDAVAEYDRLTAEVDSKIGTMQQLQNELQSLSDMLTGSKTKRAIIYTVGGIGVLGLCYFAAKQLGLIKF